MVRKFVVVGDVMLDVVVKPERTIAPSSDTPSRIGLHRGGAAANVAEALALAGHDVTYVGACGNDLAARLFEDSLRAVGVNVEVAHVDAASGVVVALVDDDGQRAMMTDRGANSKLAVEHVLGYLEEPFDHLHVSGYLLLDRSTTDVGRSALARAGELGRSTSVDVCSVAPLREMTPAVFLDAARGASMLFANEEEALTLSGESDVTSAMERLGGMFREVVITRGGFGARALCDGFTYEAQTKSDGVVDTTGAGDAATGAYLALRLRGATIDEALDAAMTAASFVVGGLGSRGQSPL